MARTASVESDRGNATRIVDIVVVLLKNSNAACRWVLADLVLVDHHVDTRDARGVHLVLGLLASELGEELKQLRFAGFHLQAVVVVELDQVLLVVFSRVLMLASGLDRAVHHARR